MPSPLSTTLGVMFGDYAVIGIADKAMGRNTVKSDSISLNSYRSQ